MFTVELKINGALVGHIHGQNIGNLDCNNCEYSYEYYDVSKREISKGTITHARSDGIRNLIRTILDDLNEKN